MTDHDKLYEYVEGVFQKSQKTEWPTVREVATSMKWTHARVEEAASGDPDYRLMLTGYNVEDQKLGDLFVETL